MCHCNNNAILRRRASHTPGHTCLSARAKWKNLPDFCVYFLIFVFASWFSLHFPIFFSLCVQFFLAILNAVRNSGARLGVLCPLCSLVVTRAHHDYATRPSYFEVINHKINNQSSGVATGGSPWQRKICQKLEKKKEKIKADKRGTKWGKIGKVLSLCPSWQIGLATLLNQPSTDPDLFIKLTTAFNMTGN